ncbi:guanine nucleotide-binding protein subunit alpha-11-like [Calliphora vicina]|uniref:guanine nucleotide-binding protein subunit alpha-11-like n=1 Tax=Calliphora vicina TaxID=7373 RepID=UPI00325AB870
MDCFSLKKLKKQEVKLLLLGTAGSGKSTFIRQMRILYDNGYSDEERRHYIKLIHENILTSMQNMIAAMESLKIDYEKSNNATKNVMLIKNINSESNACLEDPYLTVIKELWNDKGIQNCYMRRNEYQLHDSTKYYMNEIDRIALTDYMPTDQDILRAYIPSTGLIKYPFKVNSRKFRMIDVAGSRSERKKWCNCFEYVGTILYFVAISEYDQVLEEHEQSNRLKESLNVFKTVTNKFNDIPIILFFNKVDLFEEKIMYSHLEAVFPQFKGPRCDSKAALQFIADMFLEVRSQTFYYPTCATDTDNIKIAFNALEFLMV